MRRTWATLGAAALVIAAAATALTVPAGASTPGATFGTAPPAPPTPPTAPPPLPDAFLSAAAGADGGAEAGRSVTVTPGTDLVDGQLVTVDGSGFTDVAFVGIFQCAKGLGIDGCDLSTAVPEFDVDAGTFSEPYYLSALLDTDAGPIDCRTHADGCRLVVNERFALAGSARADLGFDPAGPLAPPPTVQVDPDTDLVDRQVVHVTASGFRPEEPVVIGQCPAGATDPTEECGGEIAFAQADDQGEVSEDVTVRAVFRTYFGSGSAETDCRTTACEVAVAAGDDYRRFGTAPVGFDPDAPVRPDLDVEVTPHTDLVDGQVVQVHGVGFTPGGPVDVVECSIDSGLDGDACELDRVQHLTATTDPDGTIDTTYAVNDVLDTERGPIDCRERTCILVAVDRSGPIDFGVGYRFVSLSFRGGDVPPSAPADPTAVTPAFTG